MLTDASSRRIESLPVWGAWIETSSVRLDRRSMIVSLPVWGAWIETLINRIIRIIAPVAPRVGGVD